MNSFITNMYMRPLNNNVLASIGTFLLCYWFLKLVWYSSTYLFVFFQLPPKKVVVTIENEEMSEKLEGLPKFDTKRLIGEQKKVFLWDPSTLDYFGEIPVMNKEEVKVLLLNLLFEKISLVNQNVASKNIKRMLIIFVSVTIHCHSFYVIRYQHLLLTLLRH